MRDIRQRSQPETFRYVVTILKSRTVEVYEAIEPWPNWDWPLEFEFENNTMNDFTGRVRMAFVGWQKISCGNSRESFAYLVQNPSPYDTLSIGPSPKYNFTTVTSIGFIDLEITENEISGIFIAGGPPIYPARHGFTSVRAK